MENVNFATWMSVLTWFNLSEVKVINKVKVFQGQIVSVSLSISKRDVGLRLKGILVSNAFGLKLMRYSEILTIHLASVS